MITRRPIFFQTVQPVRITQDYYVNPNGSITFHILIQPITRPTEIILDPAPRVVEGSLARNEIARK